MNCDCLRFVAASPTAYPNNSTYTHISIYIYMCVCVCVCGCVYIYIYVVASIKSFTQVHSPKRPIFGAFGVSGMMVRLAPSPFLKNVRKQIVFDAFEPPFWGMPFDVFGVSGMVNLA